MADLFPEAYVVGTDLSPIQPTWVPPNLQFEVSDCESEWSFQTAFDLIHMRNLSGSICDWPRLLVQAKNSLKDQGWLDIANIDIWAESNNNSLPADSALAQWRTHLLKASRQAGRELRFGRSVRGHMIAVGYAHVVEEIFQVSARFAASRTWLSRTAPSVSMDGR